MAAYKKNAARLGAYLVFVDESGFLLVPSVVKTWAPRGETPILHHRYRRDKISAISGVSVSPRHQRLGLYFQLHMMNIGHLEVCEFVRHMLRHLRGPVIIVWDNGTIHKGDSIRELCRRFPRLHLERFPSYAPELNPDENVWSQTKRALANGRPDDLLELSGALLTALEAIQCSQSKLYACIASSDLPPFLR